MIKLKQKKLSIVLIILAVAAVLAVVRFWTPEDNWICVNGEWTKHGNPSMAKPIELCPGAESAKKENNDVYQVYFSNKNLDPQMSCFKVFPVVRPAGTGKFDLNRALELLLNGVSEKEKQDGYFTSIPPNVKINLIKKSGTAITVDFSKDIENNSGGSCHATAIKAQIYWTIIKFDTSVRSVNISVEGETETALQP